MPEQNVLIIGGGIAGLTAAEQLAAMKIPSILVEKQSVLGGYAAGYACKATQACVKCGACVVAEALHKVCAEPTVEVLTGSRAIEVVRGGRFRVTIQQTCDENQGQLTREADAVILATGFKPFDPKSKPYGYGRFPNVVTNLELERILREHSIPVRPSDDKTPERIAFVQCVGSRDEHLGHLWCSKVCCASALRAAGLIKMRRPQIDITFFYIDVQTFGKEFQTFYNGIRDDVTMIRTLPGDVFPAAADRLRMVFFDPRERRSREELFDLIVLSVGITPAAGNRELARLFQVTLEQNGFLPGRPGPGVFSAGTARGPMSIAESIVSAGQASLLAAEYLRRNPSS
jgi:heterodisulfide reductase subunit A